MPIENEMECVPDDFEILGRASESETGVLSIFEGPLCLVDSDASGSLFVHENVLKQLEEIDKVVNVVAIAGLYRTGKSYLLNRLAGRMSGFALGANIESKTKGIWVWCTPHPRNPDEVLVLLDTEGLGDVAKGNANHDNWIFSLATLLSSTLVYNILGVLNESAIEKLNFVTEVSKHIKTKNNEDDVADYDLYFPDFVIALRDFTLDLELNGKECTADEYLEHALSLLPEKDERNKRYNDTRRCIRRYFKSRKCFTFDRPGNKKTLKNLENLTDADLDEEFVKSVEDFCTYIYTKCPAKKLDTGIKVTGRMLATLVRSYVTAIREGAVPCIENALNTMAELENTKTVSTATELYEKRMSEELHLPTNSESDLISIHHNVAQEAIAYFLKKAFYDEKQVYQRKLNDSIEEKFQMWKKNNETFSQELCEKFLEELEEGISTKMETGEYLCNGGYAMFQEDLHLLQNRFEEKSGLGVKAQDCLIKFLKSKRDQGQTILKADQKLSEEEKKLEAERQAAAEAERVRQSMEKEAAIKAEHEKRIVQMMQENIQQLEKKRVEDMENIRKHNEETLEHRLKEQARTLQEGFRGEAEGLQRDIRRLEEQNKKKKGGCFADTSIVSVLRPGQEEPQKTMLCHLTVGDCVESYDFENEKYVFSPVYFITHSVDNDGHSNELLLLRFDGSFGKHGIRMDASHLIYASKRNAFAEGIPSLPIRASEVEIGDKVWVKDADRLIPRPVVDIRKVNSGIRHPMTMNHVIIVDGVLASVHMYHERIYRALTSPLRWIYRFSPTVVQNGLVTKLVNAWDYVEKLL